MKQTLETMEKGARQATRVTGRLLAYLVWLVTALCAIGAVAAPISHFLAEQAKQAALEAGPPALTPIEDFDRATHEGAFGEVALRAQAVPSRLIRKPSADTPWMLPVFATDAAEPDAAPLGWLVHDTAAFTPETLQSAVQGRGPIGFLLEFQGRRIDPSAHFAAVKTVSGGAFDPTARLFQPYLGDREARLAPAPFNWLLWGAFVLGVIASFFYGLKNWKEARAADP